MHIHTHYTYIKYVYIYVYIYNIKYIKINDNGQQQICIHQFLFSRTKLFHKYAHKSQIFANRKHIWLKLQISSYHRMSFNFVYNIIRYCACQYG